MIIIEIDDLVGNAFANYLKETGRRKLSLEKIEKYGDKVAESLRRKGNPVKLVLSRTRTRNFFREYFNIFDYDEDSGIVTLDYRIRVKDLTNEFCGTLNLKLLKEFQNKENINCLF